MCLNLISVTFDDVLQCSRRNVNPREKVESTGFDHNLFTTHTDR